MIKKVLEILSKYDLENLIYDLDENGDEYRWEAERIVKYLPLIYEDMTSEAMMIVIDKVFCEAFDNPRGTYISEYNMEMASEIVEIYNQGLK